MKIAPHPLLRRLLALVALLAFLPMSAHAQMLSEARLLRTGQFLWDDARLGAADDLSIRISIAEQKLFVYSGGQLVGMSTVSTGSPGHATPRGTFTVLEKDRWHRSNIYSNAPMPFMQRLTWSGIALHGGHLPGYPASHGCIRLPIAFARRLFEITSLGVPVTIVEGIGKPVVTLRFADIEWLVMQDSDVLASEEAVRSRDARRPHWANPAEIEAVRRNAVRLEYDEKVLTE